MFTTRELATSPEIGTIAPTTKKSLVFRLSSLVFLLSLWVNLV